MVALDSSHDIPAPARASTSHAGQIVLFALLIAALVAVASPGFAGDGINRWQFAADMVSRFSLLLFVALMVVEPLARLIPTAATETAARERPSLMFGFAGATAVSLACQAAPMWIGGEKLGAPTLV